MPQDMSLSETDRETLIVLNTIEGFGIVKLRSLLGLYPNPSAILEEKNASGLQRAEGIGESLSKLILDAALDRQKLLSAELGSAAKNKARILTPFDPDYPANLSATYDPPMVLYVKGDLLPEDISGIGVVGTRRPSHYGVSMTERISSGLASSGFTVVSGMARGVDTIAHRSALSSGGRTLAVLGSGLGKIYPVENKKLFDRVCESGAAISEFPYMMGPEKRNFPRRNRIISGLSLGVVVVEATSKSGSLITAAFAAEQGREVFAVPGRADSAASEGTHNLIKDGARLVASAADIIDELEPVAGKLPRRVPAPGAVPGEAELPPLLAGVYSAIGTDPMHIDDIARKAGVDAPAANSALLMLEIAKRIKQLPGKMFMRSAAL